MAKDRKKGWIQLRYSLHERAFESKVWKRLAARLRSAISKWTKEKSEGNAEELVQIYVRALSVYWKKTGLKGIKEYAYPKITPTVNLVYKKGRKSN